MKKDFIAICALALLPWSAIPQIALIEESDDEEYTATYAVTDVTVPEKSRLELWTFQVVAQIEKGNALNPPRVYLGHEITRETFGKRDDGITETTKIWHSEIRTEGGYAYLKEIFAPPADAENPSGRSFGRVEKRDLKTDELIESWPVFLYKEPCAQICRIITTSFFPNGYVEQITREFKKEDIIFPSREIHITSQLSEVTSHLVYEKIK